MGAGIAASAPDAQALARRDPGCCQAEYLDQPVSPYTVDVPLDDGQILRLGDADWEVVRTPGHTPGHLSLWQPEERLLVVGDALSDYDVGWVNLALDGPQAAATALAFAAPPADLGPRVLLPAHGPIPADSSAAFTAALRRAQRLVDDPAGAVWYAARRIFAFALMIHDGIPLEVVEPYLHARVWLVDAARLLSRTPEGLAAELIDTMLRNSAIVSPRRAAERSCRHTSVTQRRSMLTHSQSVRRQCFPMKPDLSWPPSPPSHIASYARLGRFPPLRRPRRSLHVYDGASSQPTSPRRTGPEPSHIVTESRFLSHMATR